MASIPEYELSLVQEAGIYAGMVDERSFNRGFKQVIQSLLPPPPEGPLLQAAAEFIADDTERFGHVEGMSEVFASDDYALGVVMGLKAYREQQRIARGELRSTK